MCVIAWIFKHWIGWYGLTALATLLLVLVGIATAVYLGLQLADFRRESRIKHMIDLVNQFEIDPLATSRRRLAEQRLSPDGVLKPLDPENPPDELYDIMNFFEHMGYLLDGNYLSLEDVAVEFHYWILRVWADAAELAKAEQEEDPIYYEFFERMVKRLQEYDRPRTGKLASPSKSDIEDFYSVEAHLVQGSPMPRKRRRKRRRWQRRLNQSSTPAPEGSES